MLYLVYLLYTQDEYKMIKFYNSSFNLVIYVFITHKNVQIVNIYV